MRKVMNGIINLVTECDLFSAGVVLRYRKDDNFKTFTSGCISLSIIVLLAAFFVTNIIALANMSSVNISEIATESYDPTNLSSNTDKFLFAIGLSGIDLNQGDRYFNIKVTAVSVINGTKTKPTLNMQPCTSDQWSKFGDNIASLYSKLQLQKWICPVPGQTIELQGKFTSDVFKYIKVSASTCTGTVNGQGCRTAAQINSFLSVNEYFNLNYYFVNDIKMYTNTIPISTNINDMTTYVFTPGLGSLTNLFCSTFHIDTDDSILPTSSTTSNYYGINIQPNLPSDYYIPYLGEYVKLYIRKSPTTYQTHRSYLKIDAMLSNVGGLFSIVLMLLQLPLYYYNSYCYELSLASDLFTYERKEDQQKDETKPGQQEKITQFQKMSNKFNFAVYLAYLPFVLIRKLRCKPNWVFFSALYETMHEIRRMTDMCRMMQRFQYIDRVCKLLLDEDQRRLIHLQQKETIEEIRKERNHYKLYRKLVVETTMPMPLISLVLRSSEGETDTLTQQQREVINAYNILKNNKAQINQTIVGGLDRQVIHYIHQTLKLQEQRKKRRLALQRSLTMDSKDGLNSSVMRLEDIGPDNTEPSPVYRFNDHSPRIRHL